MKNLGIKLNFEKYISNICKKASNQINAICRLQTFMGRKEKEAMINTFVHSNVNYYGTGLMLSLYLAHQFLKVPK